MSWTHPGPNAFACLTPPQGATGRGAFQRSGPTGGAANAIPLNVAISSATVPATLPPVTFAAAICAGAGEDSSIDAASAVAARILPDIPFSPLPARAGPDVR